MVGKRAQQQLGAQRAGVEQQVVLAGSRITPEDLLGDDVARREVAQRVTGRRHDPRGRLRR